MEKSLLITRPEHDLTTLYISKIERGERRIDAVELAEFAKVHGKSMDYFISQINIMNILFFVVCTLYFLAALKVDEWITISTLGFKTEIPIGFLKNPGIYKGVSSLLFFTSVVLLFFTNFKVVAGAIILLAWFLTGYLGHKIAYLKYRQVLREMLDVAETEEEKKDLQDSLEKDDVALADEILRSIR